MGEETIEEVDGGKKVTIWPPIYGDLFLIEVRNWKNITNIKNLEGKKIKFPTKTGGLL